MHKYLIKLLTCLLFISAAFSGLYAQTAFNVVLDRDSVYRYNTALSSIDSLLSADYKRLNFTDTAFDNSFGRAEVIDLDRMVFFALNNYPELKSMNYKIESNKLLAEQKDYLPDPMFEFMLDNIMTDFKGKNQKEQFW